MKLKRTVLLAAGMFALGLFLGASAAQAEPIVIVDGDTATHIQNLDVDGTLYNVAFLRTSGDDLYGDPPVFDFTDEVSAKAAKIAAVVALNTDNRATKAGSSADQSAPDWGIGYELEEDPLGGQAIKVQNASYSRKLFQDWVDADIDIWPPAEDNRIYADFTLAGPPPDPVDIGGRVSGLAGSGLVLQNSGRDDLPITEDGSFTFDTPRLPGTFYDVTVAANPTNPAQTCSVANGGGTVPTTDVTDVAVTCDEPLSGDLVKVAAEGDTLPDGTPLRKIAEIGGVAINIFGDVVFHGETGGVKAVFTQHGLVAKVGDNLDDGTNTLKEIYDSAGVAINPHGPEVAFHGAIGIDSTNAVLVGLAPVAEGDNASSE